MRFSVLAGEQGPMGGTDTESSPLVVSSHVCAVSTGVPSVSQSGLPSEPSAPASQLCLLCSQRPLGSGWVSTVSRQGSGPLLPDVQQCENSFIIFCHFYFLFLSGSVNWIPVTPFWLSPLCINWFPKPSLSISSNGNITTTYFTRVVPEKCILVTLYKH